MLKPTMRMTAGSDLLGFENLTGLRSSMKVRYRRGACQIKKWHAQTNHADGRRLRPVRFSKPNRSSVFYGCTALGRCLSV